MARIRDSNYRVVFLDVPKVSEPMQAARRHGLLPVVLYAKPIFCSIQPFQASLVPRTGCNQLDVQCYTAQQFPHCLQVADRLGGRSFNTFLWEGP